MTGKIVWIVVAALVAVGAMFWFGKAVEEKEDDPEKKTPQA
jgi:flagellar basal body-associated protein FliL